MKLLHVFICLAIVVLLVWLNRTSARDDMAAYGGLSWVGWLSIGSAIIAIGLVVLLNDSARAIGFFRLTRRLGTELEPVRTLDRAELDELGLSKYRGPEYPHPVIFPDRCIGCDACVNACPHDVLKIVDGRAAAVAPELCMEDTACQAECPVNPKAVIVINTTKQVRSLPAPVRASSTYQTNVPGCFIIGDVSGVPLIKNAVKEGYEVIKRIAGEIIIAPAEPKAALDVAIIGIGPGGASAAATAEDMKLRYVAIEQERALATIQAYPKGKYIFFKPDTKDWFGGIQITGLGSGGDVRENILDVWLGSLADVRINEYESCQAVTRAEDGDYFVIRTMRGSEKTPQTYTARRVVIAIGLRGAPNKLRLPNEDLKIMIDGRAQSKVLYALTNSGEFRGRRLAVVGGGNSAVEAAVDLAAKRVGSTAEPRSPEERNHVTLLVRDYLAPTVKFSNKYLMYHCFDQGLLDIRFGVAISEMRDGELVLEDVQTKRVVDTIPNDFVFALIGGERPDRFLKSIGIEIA